MSSLSRPRNLSSKLGTLCSFAGECFVRSLRSSVSGGPGKLNVSGGLGGRRLAAASAVTFVFDPSPDTAAGEGEAVTREDDVTADDTVATVIHTGADAAAEVG